MICGTTGPVPKNCVSCGGLNFLEKGYGIEKVYNILTKSFPEKTIARFDRDELTTQKKVRDRLEEFRLGKVDLLIGTQMITKGHHFPKVTAVVVLAIDHLLFRADFRGSEVALAVLTQVSGRAGRGDRAGEVFIQTSQLQHPIFQALKKGSLPEFYQSELSFRKELNFPPYSQIVTLHFSSRSVGQTAQASRQAYQFLAKVVENQRLGTIFLGRPGPSSVEKRANQYCYNFLQYRNG